MSQYVHYIGMSNKASIPVGQFPILSEGHYANHAAISPWPLVASTAVREFAMENCAGDPGKNKRWLLRETDLRTRLAGLVNAGSADDIALLKNTTEGINTVANGIDWQAGDNVVIPAGEFPSNRLPWLALERQGVKVREVDIRAGHDPEQALLSHMDTNTRLLAVSAVQWTDGLRLKLDILGKDCRRNDVLFFVDAIQQLGAMQLDVDACCIDFLAADGHKWLLSPEGIAVFYCRQSAREQLRLTQHGWRMVDSPYRFNRDQWPPSKTARRFEAGSPNMLGQAAFHASVSLLQNVGMEYVEAYVTENSRALSTGLSLISAIEPVQPFELSRVSGIVSFRAPDLDTVVLYRQLQERQLSCAIRGDAIRLSPHFYQAGKPVQEMLDVIDQTIKDFLV